MNNLMNREEVCEALKLTTRQVSSLIRSGLLARHPKRDIFSREQVERIQKQWEADIIQSHESKVGPKFGTLGSVNRKRTRSNLD